MKASTRRGLACSGCREKLNILRKVRNFVSIRYKERVFVSEKRVSRVGACVRECGVSALREGDEREGDDDGALSAAPR